MSTQDLTPEDIIRLHSLPRSTAYDYMRRAGAHYVGRHLRITPAKWKAWIEAETASRRPTSPEEITAAIRAAMQARRTQKRPAKPDRPHMPTTQTRIKRPKGPE